MIVFLCIIALVLILLLFKIKIIINYDEKFLVHIKYLFFDIDLLKKIRNINKKDDKAVKEKKPQDKTEIFLQIIKNIKRVAKSDFYDLKRNIIIRKLKLDLQVGVEDAKETALLCGHIYNIIYAIDMLAFNDFSVKDKKLNVMPKFNEMYFKLCFEFECSTSLINAIAIFVLIFYRLRKKQ